MRATFAALLLSAAVPAQTSAALDALEAGDVVRALDLLEAGAAPTDPDLLLRVIELLSETPAADAALQERALGRAALLLPEQVPSGFAARARVLAGAVGRGLTRLLVAHEAPLVDGRLRDRTQLGAGMAAFHALRQGGLATGADMLSLGLYLAPLLLIGERPRDAVTVAEDALAVTPAPTPEQARALRSVVAAGLLQLGRPQEALPFVKQVVQSSPGDAAVVLPLVRGLPPSLSAETFAMLRTVVRTPPSDAEKPAWTECLTSFYATAERLADRRSTAELVADLSIRMPLPQTWHQVLWGDGYRIWLDPDARPTKIASGKDALVLPVPQSYGWRRRPRPPEELTRWNNCAYCLQRGESGPVLAVYWFGPNLEYWYGDSPVERGVTAKTVRGHSAGAIARLVFDIAYGEDAERRQQRFKPHAALPFALAEQGQRRTFALGDTVYDETVFSHGQVTIEVLLRVDEGDLATLEPELRWMYQNLHKD